MGNDRTLFISPRGIGFSRGTIARFRIKTLGWYNGSTSISSGNPLAYKEDLVIKCNLQIDDALDCSSRDTIPLTSLYHYVGGLHFTVVWGRHSPYLS